MKVIRALSDAGISIDELLDTESLQAKLRLTEGKVVLAQSRLKRKQEENTKLVKDLAEARKEIAALQGYKKLLFKKLKKDEVPDNFVNQDTSGRGY